MPERIQLSRKRGFCLQRVSRAINGLGAVKVDRATQWGNPFVSHSPEFNRIAVRLFEEHLRTSGIFFKDRHITRRAVQQNLKGKNLACWCQLSEICHADVLLAVANEEQL